MQKSLLQGAVIAFLATSAFADYSNTVMSLSPLAYWQLNETTPPPVDIATNSGTLGAPGTGYYVSGATHPIAGALANGTSLAAAFPDLAGNRVVVPYQPALATASPFSVEFWANPNATSSGENALMCAASMTQFGNPPGAGDGTRKGWLFYQNGGAGWIFRTYGTGNAAFSAQGNLTQVPGTWYHIVGVYDGTNTTLYINGQQSATLAAPTYVPVDVNASPFSIGTRGYGALGYFRYNGSVDEAAYYTNILTPGEILAHYQNGTNSASAANSYSTLVQTKSPLVYLHFDEPTYSTPDPSTLPVAKNRGSLTNDADGHYQSGTKPGQPGTPLAGIATPNYATVFDPTSGGWINAGTSEGLNFTGPFTISTWFKTSPTDARFQSFIGKGDSSWRAGIDGNGNARFAFGSNPDATGTANLNDAKWHQLVGVYDGSNLVMYVDGQVDVTIAAPNVVGGNPDPVTLGTVPDYGNDRLFKGSMDEIALFGTNFTAGQVQQLYFSANPPPRITQQPPATITASEGTAVNFSATAFGPGPLVYQWIKNGTNVPGKTTASYSIAVSQTNDSGNYALVVTNAYGAVTSSVVALLVQSGPPIVLVDPKPATRYAGLTASFSVVAGGSAPLTYQWLFNGGNLGGQTATNLTLSNVQAGNAGNYSVRVTNPQGSVTSAVVALTVLSTPTAPYAAAVLTDSPIAYWRLGESSGATAFDYVGGKDGVYTNALLGQQGYAATDSNTAARFGTVLPGYIGSISSIDFATNVGVTSFTLELWVKGGLQGNDSGIITKGTGAGGEQFNLDCGAGGAFRFFVRDAGGGAHLCNSSIKPDGAWHYLVAVCDGTAQTVTLYIDGVSAASTTISGGVKTATQPMTIGARQSGTAAFDNQFDGTIDEVAIYASALQSDRVSAHFNARYPAGIPPVIATGPASLTNYLGLLASFNVDAGGPPTLTYQWQFNAADLAGATDSTLNISPLAATNAGNYRVIVANSFGSVTSSPAVLTLLVPPTNLNVGAGLVLHLPFEGSYADTSGRNNNGTNVGATTFVPGKVGTSALHYNTDTGGGIYNYVSLGKRADLNFSSNVNFTVSYWVRMIQAGGDLPFFCNAAGSGFSPGYTFAPSYNLGGWSWTLNGTGVYGADTSINDTAWHHLVHTFDRAGQGITYLDGNKVDSRPISGVGSIDQDARTCVGQDPTGTYGESGEAEIDDIGVWRRALTPLEAASIYIAAVSNNVTFSASAPITMSIVPVGAQLQISWTGSGTLQAAGVVTGTYTNIPGATSPYLLSPTGSGRFFRVAQ